jgi:integrase
MRRARGEGRLFRPTYTDKASGQHKRAGVWWIQYHDPRRPVGQQKLRESSGSTKKGEAVKLLQKRLAEVRAGRPTGPDVDKVTVGELFQMLRDDYRLNERRSLGRLEECLAHLTTHFGENTKALAVAEDRIAAYTLARKDEGAANATINRELSALKRAFRLGERAQKVARRPHVALLAENNRRKGFFERHEHEQIKAKLPTDGADLAEFLFWSGWRRGEAIGLRWSNVDLGAGIIRIETTKSGEPRTLPDAAQKELGAIVPWVFHRDGQPIRHFRRSWITACVKAGLGHEVREKDVVDDGPDCPEGQTHP